MKKLIAVVFALTVALAGIGCAGKESTSDPALKVYAPDGAPAFALAGLMEGDKYDFTVVPSATIGAQITQGTADLLIIPTNGVVNQFNKGKDYRILATATRGNLYIVGKSDAELTLNSLSGSTVGVIGMGQTPDLVFRYILTAEGIDFAVTDAPENGQIGLRYFSDGSQVVAQLAAGQIDFGLFAEPLVTNALSKIEGSKTLDVQKLYEEAEDGNSYGFPQAVLAVKYETYSSRKAEVDAFVEAFVAAKDYAAGNPADALARVKANVAPDTETSIPSLTSDAARRCNIVNEKLTETAKADINAYIQRILDLEADSEVSSVGGKLPDESIYIL